MSWEAIYNFLGVKDFIYFISAPGIQDTLFPVKLVFVTFAMFFLAAVIYFMLNSSWLQYKFMEDVTEFFSWQSYGMRAISKHWNKIKKRIEAGSEAEYKLAIIEADDFLMNVLDEKGYEGKDFQEIIEKAGRTVLSNMDEIIRAHEIRNFIVFNPEYKLDQEQAKKLLNVYESAVNNVGIG